MLANIMRFCFYVSFALLVIPYILYPIMLAILAAFRSDPVKSMPFSPSVSLIIPARNEGESVRDKIDNSFQLDYPKDLLQVILVSDGSTDDTAQVVEEMRRPGLVFIELQEHRGKVAALNAGVSVATGEILVFSDAHDFLRPDALKILTSCFADDSVGCASGSIRWTGSSESKMGKGTESYWKYESFLKNKESALGSILGAVGTLYACRKELFPEDVPEEALLDDFVIPMKILFRGLRVVFVPDAIAEVKTSRTPREEFRKKTRTLRGHYQALLAFGFLRESVQHNLVTALQMLLHKVLPRLLLPALIVALTISAVFCFDLLVPRVVLLTLVSVLAIGTIGSVFRGTNRHRAVQVSVLIATLIGASFVALWQFVSKRNQYAW